MADSQNFITSTFFIEKVRLTVKPPADFTILEGIPKRLECKATGSPLPKIGCKNEEKITNLQVDSNGPGIK